MIEVGVQCDFELQFVLRLFTLQSSALTLKMFQIGIISCLVFLGNPRTVQTIDAYDRPCHEVIACEHTQLTISCPTDVLQTHIHVVYANYGRTLPYVESCPSHPTNRTDCYNASSMPLVTEICEGKQSCTVESKNDVFGDPCHRSFKYLRVHYCCYHDAECKDVITCEGTTFNLSCHIGGHVNHIMEANYGRTQPGSEVCPQAMADVRTDCNASSSKSVVTAACNGKPSCTLKPYVSIFGDPCPGTHKYLKVRSCCYGDRDCHEVTTCEHTTLRISCPANYIVNVEDANYGRTLPGSEVCPHPLLDVYTTNCYAVSSMAVMTSRCEGYSSCAIDAENDNFGDPCIDTFKYLRVRYCCFRYT